MNSISTITRFFLTVPEHISLKEQRFYILGNLASIFAALFHASLILLFWLIDIQTLFYFNFFSVSVFILSLYLNRVGSGLVGFAVGMVEVIIHQILCVLHLGWDAGFQYYLIASISFPFLFWHGRNALKLIFVFACSITYLILDIFFSKSIPFQVVDKTILEFVNSTNIIFSITIISLWVFYFHKAVNKAEDALEKEHQRAEDLLHNILPVPIANRLKGGSRVIADAFENVTILFADIVGFTELSETTRPEKIVEFLNSVFSRFDELAEKHGLEKIKTIGDAYMVAAGIPENRDDHAEAIASFALDIKSELDQINRLTDHELRIRIGVNSGPVVAGVIGKRKFAYDVWGDCVNTAARMESHGIPGEIQVTEDSYHLLKDKFDLEKLEPIDVKGKGTMTTYLLKQRK